MPRNTRYTGRTRRGQLPRPMRGTPEERMHEQAGSLRDRYDIYVQSARSLGERVKTFDEWLCS